MADYSVLMCWGEKEDGIYLIDAIRGKWAFPLLIKKAIKFWTDMKYYSGQIAGQDNWLECMYIEDASSGIALLDHLRMNSSVAVRPLKRGRLGKLERVNAALPHVEAGRVFLPELGDRTIPILPDIERELSQFSQEMTHPHDDCVDTTVDGINILLNKQQAFKASITSYRLDF